MLQEKKQKDTVRLESGMSIALVVESDMANDRSDIRRSIVYDIAEGNRIILSQTTPPIASYHLNRSMEVTFLNRSQGRPTRFGITAKLLEIVKEYKLYSDKFVPALLMKCSMRGFSKVDLRMFYRVTPTPTHRIKFFLDGKELTLMELSLGNVCFIHGLDNPIDIGRYFKAQIEIDGSEYDVDIKIIRTWSNPDLRKNGLGYVAAQFMSPEKQLNFVLGGKVLEIERELLSRGLE